MDPQHNLIEILRSADRPAFLVEGGVITQVNQEAANRMIRVGDPVEPMLVTGQEEYAAFREGWLVLSVRAAGTEYGATVHTFGQYQIFTLESGGDDPRLTALSLAAVELRRPLGNITVTADQLFSRLGPEEDEHMARIKRNLAQLQRLINNMSGAAGCYRAPLDLELQDVDAVLSELFARAADLCQEAGVTLTYTGLKKAVFSLIDADRMERCIYNIISNSLKHMNGKGTIHAALTKQGNSLSLKIQDSGTGLPKPMEGDLFDRYRREPGILDANGIGLGMRLIRSAVIGHGGTVMMSPDVSRGALLIIRLPIRQDATQLRHTPCRVDYAGEQDHPLIELSDSLPWELYKPRRD